MPWPPNPLIYEIHTWAWLTGLSAEYHRPVDLGSLPSEIWDELAGLGFDAIWLMGVWERSPLGRAISMRDAGNLVDFRGVLPDFQPGDNTGSPYSVRRYQVDERLGGREGLAAARQALHERGMRLVVDFVPNHTAHDHPWVAEHPEYFIHGAAADLESAPRHFFRFGEQAIANGRDPYFPPWEDVAQVNAFQPGLRQAALETLLEIAAQADGVRCDMAMLLVNRIFAQTWGGRAGSPPAQEYWRAILPPVRQRYPEFLAIAEVYWDMEGELLELGFDYCYDKRLYDLLLAEGAASVRAHLAAVGTYQDRLVRFIENHDEARAAAAFSPGRLRAAALATASLPGARLFHSGQLEGRRVKLPVFLGRLPPEPPDLDLRRFYQALLRSTQGLSGEWRICETNGWPDNLSHQNLLAWSWRAKPPNGEDRFMLVVINYSDASASGMVRLPWQELGGLVWRFQEVFSQAEFELEGDALVDKGWFVDLPAWGYFIAFSRPFPPPVKSSTSSAAPL